MDNSESRRGFIKRSLAGGFALASGAQLAQAIHTESTGLVAGPVEIPVPDGKIPGYRALPAHGGKFPAVLVVQEIFGVHEHIKDVCRRFAKLGYYAIAPEMFARQGDVSGMSGIDEIMTKIVPRVPDAQVMADLDAALAFAASSGHVDSGRASAVGFCWGGRAVWLYAVHNPKLRAGVAYYGRLKGMTNDIKPKDPLDVADSLIVPVLGLYAGLDIYIKADAVEQMRAELAKGSSGSEIIVFPGVNHGFNADYRPDYDKIAADYAWKLAHEWLRDHGA